MGEAVDKWSALFFPRQSLTVTESEQYRVRIHGQITCENRTLTGEELLAFYIENNNVSDWYHRLSGRFWFVIEDSEKGEIHLCNDHLGSMPLFYRENGRTLLVSDSLKELKASSGLAFEYCNQSLFNYIYFHCIPAPHTVYQNTFKLEPGCWLKFGDKGATSTVVYSPEFNTAQTDAEPLLAECLEQIDHAVGNEVTEDCGAFLSGGLDSSTVAGMLARHKDKAAGEARTFSIGFRADDYDETPYAQITANHFSTKHEVLYLEPDDAAKEFVRVAQYFDEPFGNSSSLAAYFCAKFAKEKGVNKLLAGDGGDELFAGNERYAKQKQFELYFRVPSALRSLTTWLFTKTFLNKLPGFKKVASYIRQANVRLPGRLHTYNFVQLLGAETIFNKEFLASVDPQQPIRQLETRYSQAKSTDAVDQMLYLDWKFTLADNDLVKVSKMCELAGVEVAYPLLDKSIIDFSCRVPAEVKLPGYKLRDFYKRACKGFLADDTLTKSKHGFGLPFGVWIKENKTLETTAIDALNAFRKRKIVSDDLIEKALEAHKNVHASYYGELIWIMVVLELWLQGQE